MNDNTLKWHMDTLMLFIDLIPEDRQNDFRSAVGKFNSAHEQERHMTVDAALDYIGIQRRINAIKDQD